MTVTVDLETAALWVTVPAEARSHAVRLMTTRRPYEAMRALAEATGSAKKARRLVSWLSKAIVKGEL